jgi:hypothetical protein
MKRLIASFALLSLTALAACETHGGPPPPMHGPPPPGAATHYDSRDFAWSQRSGQNTISGRVALHTKTAGAFTCAGGSVAITPETPYSSARTMRLYGSVQHATATVESVRDRSAGDGPPPYANYVRSTTCDGDGHFAFTSLPDGAWFLITRAKPVRGEGPPLVIMKRVEARGGQTVALDLR